MKTLHFSHEECTLAVRFSELVGCYQRFGGTCCRYLRWRELNPLLR
jgi:hypothetical protein